VIEDQERQLADLQHQLQDSELSRLSQAMLVEAKEQQIRMLQQILEAIQRSRVYCILRRLGRWRWVEHAILQSAVHPPTHPEPASEQPIVPPFSTTAKHTTRASTVPEQSVATRVFDALEDYISTIQAFNKTRPDLDEVRAYNHKMIDTLAQLRPVAGKQLLDVGASPHGYALERALQEQVSTYIGIGLGIHEALEVHHQGRAGKLLNMNAEALEFEPDTFDLLLSISTFEHFSNGAQVLREMYRVLKPGGSVLVSFQPVWTCSRGHHLHHIPAVAKLIPPWGQLLWDAETMYRTCQGHWPADAPMSLEKVIEWIYKGDEINRIDIVTLQNMFYRSEFQIEWITPLLDDESNGKPLIADYLSKILPYSAKDLMTLGFSLLLNKQ
jgi:SAM-dependent methyltransferase